MSRGQCVSSLFPRVFCHISYTWRVMEQFESMISFAGQKIKTQDKDLEVERHDAQFTLINLGVGGRYS